MAAARSPATWQDVNGLRQGAEGKCAAASLRALLALLDAREVVLDRAQIRVRPVRIGRVEETVELSEVLVDFRQDVILPEVRRVADEFVRAPIRPQMRRAPGFMTRGLGELQVKHG